LMFYLLVPLLISWRTRNLVLVGVVSFASYFVAGFFIYPALFEELGYFFFPFHLGLFVLGMLAYRHSDAFLAHTPQVLKFGLVGSMFAVLFLAQWLPSKIRTFLCVTLVFLSLPILFEWTKKNKVLRWLGDLSYPIYICHILVKWAMLALAGVSRKGVASPPGWLLLIMAAGAAALLLWLVDYPVDRWRQRRLKQDSARRAPVPVLDGKAG
jgi:peptidoglycan/LPS O-acetylase OafA/YrhL